MKVSVIIPVYKVEFFLQQCVSSVLNQTYRDIEVILVDDGSPDGCPAMCDAFAKQDNRVRVIHKPNGGLSDARNAGLKIATGDYIMFVDSDDFWIDNNCLEQLMEIVTQHPECDFVNFNICDYYPQTGTFQEWGAFDNKLSIPIDKNTAICSLVASGVVPMSACSKIISKKILVRLNIEFVRGIISEDVPWFIELLEGTANCMFLNHYMYAYRKGVAGSITNNKSYNYKNFSDLLNIIETQLDKINERDFSEDAKKSLMSFLAYEVCILLGRIHMLNKEFHKGCKYKLKKYMYLLQYTDNPKVKKVSLIYKYLGFNLTEFLLRIFMNLKQYKKIK